MGWQFKWPKCSHEVDHGGWEDSWMEWPGTLSKPTVRIEYQSARCRLCDRPLLFVTGSWSASVQTRQWVSTESADHLRELRAEVARWMLDKEGEHASNTVVVKATYPITRGHLE